VAQNPRQTHPKLSLLEHLQDLPDPRVQGRTEHELIDVLFIAVCTLLCDGTGFDDMADFGRAKKQWLKTFLTLRAAFLRTTPSTADRAIEEKLNSDITRKLMTGSDSVGKPSMPNQ
jgi:hypothetical protein